MKYRNAQMGSLQKCRPYWADCQTTVLVEVVSVLFAEPLLYFSLEIVILMVQN